MVDQTDPWLSLKAALLSVFQKNSGMVLVRIRNLATRTSLVFFAFFLGLRNTIGSIGILPPPRLLWSPLWPDWIAGKRSGAVRFRSIWAFFSHSRSHITRVYDVVTHSLLCTQPSRAMSRSSRWIQCFVNLYVRFGPRVIGSAQAAAIV